jgi:hypothetical protein
MLVFKRNCSAGTPRTARRPARIAHRLRRTAGPRGRCSPELRACAGRSCAPVRARAAEKRPQGPHRDRVSAPAEPATPRERGGCHTETTRSIPLGSTTPLRYSRGTSRLFGSRSLGVRRSGTRQGPVARGNGDGRALVAREQRSERASQRRSGSPVNPWTSWTCGRGGASLTTPQAPKALAGSRLARPSPGPARARTTPEPSEASVPEGAEGP